ncbi:MAG: hypothetical protein ABH879_07895, partial [archaeon]
SINCTDEAGNTNGSQIRNISLDVTIPRINWFETSGANQQNINLSRSDDGAGNSYGVTGENGNAKLLVSATTPGGVGNNGLLIKASQPVDFSARIGATAANKGYLNWKMYYNNGSQKLFVQEGNLGTGGVYITATGETTYSRSTNTTPAYDIYLEPDDSLKLELWIYQSGGGTITFTNYWDNSLSFANLYAYALGFIDTNITSPLADTEVGEGNDFNATCNVTCGNDWCIDTMVYLDYKNTTIGWTAVGTAGSLILGGASTNPAGIGNINETYQANFTVTGNTISRGNQLRCRATSKYSNATGSMASNVTVADTTYPTVMLELPTNRSWRNGGANTFYYTPDDNHNISNCSLIINSRVNQTNYTLTEAARANFTVYSLPEATYNWSVNCTDSYGNTNASEMWQLNIDNTYPTILFYGLTEPSGVHKGRTWIYVNVTANDTNEANVTFYLYNTTAMVNSTTKRAGNRSINFTNLPDKVYFYNVTIRDKAMNTNRTATRNITLDTVRPTITFGAATEPGGLYFSRNWIYVNITAYDLNEANVTFDLFNSSKKSINSTAKGAGNRWINFTGLDDGVHFFNVTIMDKARNANSTETRNMTLDRTNPAVALSGPGDAAWNDSSAIRFKYRVTDDNPDYCILYHNASGWQRNETNDTVVSGSDSSFTAALQDGHYKWNVWCNDSAGNSAFNATNFTLYIDTGYPQIYYNPSTYTNNTWYAASYVMINVTATDANRDAVLLEWDSSNETFQNQGSSVFWENKTGLEDGTHTFRAFVNDSAGNLNATLARTVFLDTAVPNISYSNNTEAGGAYRARNWIFVNVSAADDNEANVTFSLYNWAKVPVNSTTMPAGTRSINYSNLTNGVYFYNVTIRDKALNANTTQTRNITLDTVRPAIKLDAPADNAYLNLSQVNLAYLPYDANLDACVVYHNASGWAPNETNNTPINGSRDKFTLAFSDGIYLWNVWCNDSAGNSAFNSSNFTYTVDTINPAINYTAPTPANNTNRSADAFVVNVTHSDLHPGRISLFLQNSLNITRSYSGSYTNFSLSGLSDGTYTYYARLNDSAANANQTEKRTITLDTAPPVVSPVSPGNNSWNKKENATFSFNVSDRLLLVANCSLIVEGSVNATDNSISEGPIQTIDGRGFRSGNQSWYINCTDQVANTNGSLARTLRTDLSYPLMSGPEFNLTGTEINITKNICLNVSISDTYSGINRSSAEIRRPTGQLFNISLYDAGNTTCDSAAGNGVYSVIYKVSQTGEYNWTRTYATDTAGNTNRSVSAVIWNSTSIGTITVNMTTPVADLEVNESETLTNYSFNVTCKALCDDKPQNCSNVSVYVQYNYDVATDISTSGLHFFGNRSSVRLGDLTAGGASKNATFTITTTKTSGNATWEIWCRAESGELGSYISREVVNVTINDHPKGGIHYPPNGTWLHGIEILNASLSADDQNISVYAFELDNNAGFGTSALLCSSSDSNCTFSTAVQSQCLNESWDCYLRLNLTDSDGLTNSTFITIGIDNRPPRISLGGPDDGHNFSKIAANFTFTATDLNLDTCVLYHNDSGWSANESNATLYSGSQSRFGVTLGEGYFIWNVWCNDTEGNSLFNDTNYSLTLDVTPPVIRLAAPADSSWSATENITFAYNVSDALLDVANCSLIINGIVNLTNYSAEEDVSLNFSVGYLPDGSLTWAINCSDYAGNTNGSAVMALNIDTTGPTVQVDRPRNFTNTSANTIRANATVTDAGIGVNATLFEYRENSSASWKFACIDSDGNPPYNCSWSLAALPDGNAYQLRVSANDSLGQISGYDTNYNITVDKTSPVVRLVSPFNNTRKLDGNITFVFNVSDATSKVVNCSLLFKGQANQTNITIAENASQFFNSVMLPTGGYNWSIRCADASGNAGVSGVNNVTVRPDTDAPAVNLISPFDNTTQTSEDVQFTYNVTDALSAIESCDLVLKGKINKSSSGVPENSSQSIMVTLPDGNYTWSINCTDNSTEKNVGASETWDVEVLETTTILVNVISKKGRFEKGEPVEITSNSTDVYFNTVNTNMTTNIILGNATLPWWDVGYDYRLGLNITAGPQKVLANYTLNLTVNTSTLVNQSKMLANGSDLRVVWWNNDSVSWEELDRLVYGMNSSHTNVLFRIQRNISADSPDLFYYVYYGNSTAGAPPDNKTHVYFFYDDFSTNTLGSYSLDAGFTSASESDDSNITYDGSSVDYAGAAAKGKSIRRDLAIADMIIEVDQFVDAMKGSPASSRLELGTRINGNEYYTFYASTNVYESKMYRYNSTGNAYELNKTATFFSDPDVWHHLRLEVYNSENAVYLKGYVDGTLLMTKNDTRNQLNSSGGFGVGGYQLDGNWDNLSVRRHMSTPPQSAAGSEEQLIETRIRETGLDGMHSENWTSLLYSIGNYSAVSFAVNINYKNGRGSTAFELVPDKTPPKFILQSPPDNANFTSTGMVFNWTATDMVAYNLTCNLTLDGRVNVSGINATNGGLTNVTVAGLSSGAMHQWNVSCIDESNNSNTSHTRTFTIIRAPPILAVTLDSDTETLNLTWPESSYADSYNIYYTDDYSGGFSSVPNVTGITDTNWTDSGANSAAARFYKVAAVKGEAVTITVSVAGKQEQQFDYNLAGGSDWVLGSLPMGLSNWTLDNGTNNGYDFPLRPAECVTGIWRYNESNTGNEWEHLSRDDHSWIPDAEDENFRSLEGGRGYWFEINSSCNFTLVGEVPRNDTNISLYEGWTVTGWYSPNASALPSPEPPAFPVNVDPAGSVRAINRYNTETNKWEVTIHYDDWGWWPSWNCRDFTSLEPNRGYYFDMIDNATWMHDPNT